MKRIVGRRQYRVVHEKLVLEVDLDKRTLGGYAEMVVLPQADTIKHIAFNAKGLDVLQVLVDGAEATFEYAQPAFHYSVPTPPQPPKPPAPVPAFDAKPAAAAAAGALADLMSPPAAAAAAKPAQKIAITLNPNGRPAAAAAALAAGKVGAAAAAAARARDPAYDLARIRDLRLWEFAEFEQSDRSDFGQVIVTIPKAVRKQRKQSVKALEDDVDITSTDDLLTPFVLHVLYRVRAPVASAAASPFGSAGPTGAALDSAGVHFVSPDRLLFPARPAQFYVATAKCDASLWFPCLESVTGGGGGSERCTFELEITCPAACVVVASGELSGQSYTDESKTRKTYTYNCDVPVHPHSIGLCVAPFEVTPEPKVEPLTHFHIPWWSAGASAAGGAAFGSGSGSSGSRAGVVAGAGSANGVDFAHSVSCTGAVLFGLFEEYLGVPYPFPSYSQVFMDDTYADVTSFAGLSVFSSSLLHDKHVIDQTLKTRKTLAYGLAYSWLAHSLVLKSYADLWIVHGLAHYLTMLYVERAFGNNESQWQQIMSALFVLDRDAERDSKESSDAEWRRDAEQNDTTADLMVDGTVVSAASAPAPAGAAAAAAAAAGSGAGPSFFLSTRPLFWTGYTHPIEMHDPVMARKAGVVMKMLEQKIGKDQFQGLVRTIISESSETTAAAAAAAAAAANGDADVKGAGRSGAAGGAAKQPLSTKRLMQHASRLSAEQDMKTFFDMWVFCDGYPQLKAVFNFNRKKHVTEISITQSRAQGLKFSGAIRLRVHEVNRSTEHERRVDDERQEYEFACASRLRRNRKRKQVVEDELGVEDLLQRNIETPVLWVRVDPYRQWFRFTELEQHEVMWVHQLNSDRDVVAQYEAIDGLRRLALASSAIPGASAATSAAAAQAAAAAPASAGAGAAAAATAQPAASALTATTNVLSNALRDTLDNRKYFVRIRAAAARTLAETAMTRVGIKTHLDVLFHYFRAQHCERTPAIASASAGAAAAAAAAAGTGPGGVITSLSAAVAASTAAAATVAVGGSSGSPFGAAAANALTFGQVVNAFGILKPNDFLDLPEYYMKRAIASALAAVVDPISRLTPPPITRFLLFLLANNDNSKNQFSDSHYLAQLLRSVGQLRFSKFDNVQPVWAELSRYLHYDQILPSFHNLVTSSVLESMAKMEAAGLVLDSKVAYHQFAQYGHYRGVRVSAFKCLVTLAAASAPRAVQHVPVVISTLLNERVPGVQLAMAQSWLSIYSKMGARLDVFRTPTAHNQYLMDALWHILNTCADAEFRWCIYRLYMCLWGRGLPSCVPAASALRDASRRCGELMKRDKLQEGKHARRKFKARRKLKEQRTKRGFGNIIAAPTGAVKITLSTKGKLKATEDDRPDEDEALDIG